MKLMNTVLRKRQNFFLTLFESEYAMNIIVYYLGRNVGNLSTENIRFEATLSNVSCFNVSFIENNGLKEYLSHIFL